MSDLLFLFTVLFCFSVQPSQGIIQPKILRFATQPSLCAATPKQLDTTEMEYTSHYWGQDVSTEMEYDSHSWDQAVSTKKEHNLYCLGEDISMKTEHNSCCWGEDVSTTMEFDSHFWGQDASTRTEGNSYCLGEDGIRFALFGEDVPVELADDGCWGNPRDGLPPPEPTVECFDFWNPEAATYGDNVTVQQCGNLLFPAAYLGVGNTHSASPFPNTARGPHDEDDLLQYMDCEVAASRRLHQVGGVPAQYLLAPNGCGASSDPIGVADSGKEAEDRYSAGYKSRPAPASGFIDHVIKTESNIVPPKSAPSKPAPSYPQLIRVALLSVVMICRHACLYTEATTWVRPHSAMPG